MITVTTECDFYVGSSLLWVAALGLIVIYVYAVGTFAFMPNDFDDNDGDVALFCGTLFECFVTVLDYGLLDTIGLVCELGVHTWCNFVLIFFVDYIVASKYKGCHSQNNFL